MMASFIADNGREKYMYMEQSDTMAELSPRNILCRNVSNQTPGKGSPLPESVVWGTSSYTRWLSLQCRLVCAACPGLSIMFIECMTSTIFSQRRIQISTARPEPGGQRTLDFDPGIPSVASTSGAGTWPQHSPLAIGAEYSRWCALI